MKKIILIRHGECSGNVEGLFRGRIDYPLTKNGRDQAGRLGEELSKLSIGALFTSPLSRCLETAYIISSACGARVEIVQGLVNISLGEWEGKSKRYISDHWPALWSTWKNEPEKLIVQGAETLEAVQKRSYSSLMTVLDSMSENGCSAIVTHRAVLKPLIAKLLGIKEDYFWKIHIDNCGYCVFEYDLCRFTITLLNQTSHLISYINEKE